MVTTDAQVRKLMTEYQKHGYYFGAGNIVQLALKKSERNEVLGRVGGYSATLKVSYLLRL